jgi:hypothetical protein
MNKRRLLEKIKINNMKKFCLLLVILGCKTTIAQNLQQVTDNGNSTSHSITALHYSTFGSSYIGTVTPPSIYNLTGLRINGDIPNSSYNGISYQSGGGGGAAISFSRGGSYDTSIDFYTNSGHTHVSGNLIHRLKISSEGKIGIGTTLPTSRLTINGDIRWGNEIDYIYSSIDNLGTYFEFKGTNQGLNTLRLQSSKSGDAINYSQFLIDPNHGFIFRSLGSGNSNVGIGIDQPSEKLSVNGNIRAKEIKVEINNWPDYVFEDKYTLRSLDDVAAFIKENKHLPEVPSASTVKEEGISLGEMNTVLLKKVEELTLYLLKQDSQMKEMASQILQLQQEIDTIKK